MPPSGRPPRFRVGCALDHIPPRASPVNVWFTGWREPISISGDGKVAWRYTAPAALFFDKAGFFESLAGVVRRRSRRPRIPTSEPGLRHGQHPRCDASGATARAASKNGLGAECTETAKTDTAPVLPSFI